MFFFNPPSKYITINNYDNVFFRIIRSTEKKSNIKRSKGKKKKQKRKTNRKQRKGKDRKKKKELEKTKLNQKLKTNKRTKGFQLISYKKYFWDTPNTTTTQHNKSKIWHKTDITSPPLTTHPLTTYHCKHNISYISAVPEPILTKL